MSWEIIDDEENTPTSESPKIIKPRYELVEDESERKENLSSSDYAKDIGIQGSKGLISGIGSYGDILDLLGIQSKEILPGEEAKRGREFEVLEKLKNKEVPSVGELEELTDDDVLPRYSRLATSHDVSEFAHELGTPRAKSAAGRYAERIGRLTGTSLVTGGVGLKAPVAAGLAGQFLEENGYPPWAQAAAEILISLRMAPKSTKNITSKSPEVEETISNLRKAGYSEKDITLAKNSLEERKLLKKYATMTPEAENAIQKGIKNSEEILKEQIGKGLPGYKEGGLSYLEKQASNVYQTMEDLASTIPIKNTEPVKKAIQQSIDYLEKYPLLKEQKEFIEFLKDGLAKSSNANTAEFFTGFYRNLGKAGQWGNPKQKEHILGIVQKGIKETFNQSGKEAEKFGKYFEKTNGAWKQWINTKDLMTTIEKAQTSEGINFKKLSSILNNSENHELAKKVLGPEALKNIEYINKGAQAIESMLQKIPSSNKDIQSLKLLGALGSLLSGSYKPLAALISLETTKKLATNILIDPKKQNIMKKIVDAAKNNSPQQAAILAQELINNED